MCLDRGAAVQLSAQHLEACGGTLFIAGIREGDWATAGPSSLPAKCDQVENTLNKAVLNSHDLPLGCPRAGQSTQGSSTVRHSVMRESRGG
jgi:hypothetical protein